MSSATGDNPDPQAPDVEAPDVESPDLEARAQAGAGRYRLLPDPPRPQDLTTGQDVSPGPDPEGGRNADQDWMLRDG